MIACGLEFLQVVINVNATELHPFAAISGLQKFALAWNSVLISFAHLPMCQSNIYFCSSCLDCLLMRYMTGSAWVYKCQGFKQNSSYCSKLLITLGWFHHKVVLSPAVCSMWSEEIKRSLGSTWVESISELPGYFTHWIAFISLKKALTVSYVRHYMNK